MVNGIQLFPHIKSACHNDTAVRGDKAPIGHQRGSRNVLYILENKNLFKILGFTGSCREGGNWQNLA